MRVIVQRAASARVLSDGEETGAIGPGLLLLVGVTHTDTQAEAALLAQKAARLRIFTDEQDKMNLSLLDTGGGVLVVSNFTLYADASHGRRPSFAAAARPEQAEVGFDECFVYGGHRIGVVRNGFHGQADAVVGDALVYPEHFGYLAPHGEGLVLSIFPDVRDGGHPLYYP